MEENETSNNDTNNEESSKKEKPGYLKKAFESSPLNDSFLICLDGISEELSDFTLKYAGKETRINSLDGNLEFCVRKLF